jgi:DNA (cytosine-5)-methyltransferase 1
LFFVADDASDRCGQGRQIDRWRDSRSDADTLPRSLHDGSACYLGNAHDTRLEGRQLSGERTGERAARPTGMAGDGSVALASSVGREWRETPTSGYDDDGQASGRPQGEHGPRIASSHWSGCDWIPCRDGKLRPVEPGTFPLAHGTPSRVGRLRAYGNAIVAPCAEAFIRAYLTEEIELREAA